jgi:hypothetical protein
MINRIRLICCLFILNGFTMTFIHAQDLTGIWRGHFRSNDGLEHLMGNNTDRYKLYDDRYKIEVQIAQTSNHFEAVTYSYKSAEFYGKAEASGSLNPSTKKVLLKEGKLLEVRLAYGSVCTMTCFMQYSKLGNDEYLQGTYYSSNVNDSLADCGKGSIFLHRVAETDFHKEPFLEKKENELLSRKKGGSSIKKPSSTVAASGPPKPATAGKTTPKPAAVKKTASKTASVKKQPAPSHLSKSLAEQKIMRGVPEKIQIANDSSLKISKAEAPVIIPEVLKKRTNELLTTLTVNHSNIELFIYDDGAIDNDTVSVYYDNKLIISKARLSDQPIIVRIPVEPSDRPHQLVMVAENLGDIPPNTSLMVVKDGEKRYEERIISTEQKNVVLNFQYKKIE